MLSSRDEISQQNAGYEQVQEQVQESIKRDHSFQSMIEENIKIDYNKALVSIINFPGKDTVFLLEAINDRNKEVKTMYHVRLLQNHPLLKGVECCKFQDTDHYFYKSFTMDQYKYKELLSHIDEKNNSSLKKEKKEKNDNSFFKEMVKEKAKEIDGYKVIKGLVKRLGGDLPMGLESFRSTAFEKNANESKPQVKWSGMYT